MQDHILIIEDERAIAEGLAYAFRQEGFRADIACDGEAGLVAARAHEPDLILLDLMLPGLSGWEVCRVLRKTSRVPIIMLTARAEEVDRILGLELGADDYIVKPFSTREVIARVRAVLRRSAPAETTPEHLLTAEGVSMDVPRRELTVDGKAVALSPKEWSLLEILLRNKGRVLTRDLLLERIWGGDTYLDHGTLDVHIRWVRQKIEQDPNKPARILTIRGVGYKYAG